MIFFTLDDGLPIDDVLDCTNCMLCLIACYLYIWKQQVDRALCNNL